MPVFASTTTRTYFEHVLARGRHVLAESGGRRIQYQIVPIRAWKSTSICYS